MQSAVLPLHVVRLSVRLSVTLVDCDHIGLSLGWKSGKSTAWTISRTPSLLVAQRPSTYFQGIMGKFWEIYRWGEEKVACWSTKAAISLKSVKLEEKLPWRTYMNSLTFFRIVLSQTPYTVADQGAFPQ